MVRHPSRHQTILAAEAQRPACMLNDEASVLRFTQWAASWDGPAPSQPVKNWVAKVRNRFARLLTDAKEWQAQQQQRLLQPQLYSARHALEQQRPLLVTDAWLASQLKVSGIRTVAWDVEPGGFRIKRTLEAVVASPAGGRSVVARQDVSYTIQPTAATPTGTLRDRWQHRERRAVMQLASAWSRDRRRAFGAMAQHAAIGMRPALASWAQLQAVEPVVTRPLERDGEAEEAEAAEAVLAQAAAEPEAAEAGGPPDGAAAEGAAAEASRAAEQLDACLEAEAAMAMGDEDDEAMEEEEEQAVMALTLPPLTPDFVLATIRRVAAGHAADWHDSGGRIWRRLYKRAQGAPRWTTRRRCGSEAAFCSTQRWRGARVHVSTAVRLDVRSVRPASRLRAASGPSAWVQQSKCLHSVCSPSATVYMFCSSAYPSA